MHGTFVRYISSSSSSSSSSFVSFFLIIAFCTRAFYHPSQIPVMDDLTLNQFYDFPVYDLVPSNQNFYQNYPPLDDPGLYLRDTQIGGNTNGDNEEDLDRIRSGMPLLGENYQSCSSSVTLEMQKLRVELEERSRNYLSDVCCTVERGMRRILTRKDIEVAKIKERNTTLEEERKCLLMEWKIWKEAAETNEAMVMSLCRDLELAQARKGGGGDGDNGKGKGIAEEDAMSSCEGDKTKDGKRICCCCRRNEISVLLIPCRHLCLCSECDKILASCPVCMGDKTVSIGVNVPWK